MVVSRAEGATSAKGYLRTSRAARLNVRFGSKADINGDLGKCLLSGVKRTPKVCFQGPIQFFAGNVCLYEAFAVKVALIRIP